LKCSFCRERDAFYTRYYEGVSLCQKCFRSSVEDKVRRTISKHGMFEVDDHIAVAVSGGKDSLTLLTILRKIERRFPKTRLSAVTVDEGIENYREEALEIAGEHCEKLGLKHRVLSFSKLYSLTLDSLASKVKDLAVCTCCGILRRRAIEKAARSTAATKIATAHNLDDEVQTFLLNIVHGDVARIARGEPVLKNSEGRFLPRVKPLCEIPERETALYAYLAEIRFQSKPCPYTGTSMRSSIRATLNRLEEKHPGVKYSIYGSAERLRDSLKKSLASVEFKVCRCCGEPAATELCEVCRVIERSS